MESILEANFESYPYFSFNERMCVMYEKKKEPT